MKVLVNGTPTKGTDSWTESWLGGEPSGASEIPAKTSNNGEVALATSTDDSEEDIPIGETGKRFVAAEALLNAEDRLLMNVELKTPFPQEYAAYVQAAVRDTRKHRERIQRKHAAMGEVQCGRYMLQVCKYWPEFRHRSIFTDHFLRF